MLPDTKGDTGGTARRSAAVCGIYTELTSTGHTLLERARPDHDRIDYQLATRGLAARARSAWVERAAAYALRWSDHAPVTVEYATGVTP